MCLRPSVRVYPSKIGPDKTFRVCRECLPGVLKWQSMPAMERHQITQELRATIAPVIVALDACIGELEKTSLR